MIGNDIVDLEKARLESNWRRPRYLDKICTASEQQLIMEAQNPASMLWLMWTMKEAAYKAENSISGARLYAPSQLLCRQITINDQNEEGELRASGEVQYKKYTFQTRSLINDQMIHTICCLNEQDFSDLQTNQLNASIPYIEQFNALNPGLRLTKNKAGKPAVIHQLTGRGYACSLSHHGNYLAVIYSDSLLSAD